MAEKLNNLKDIKILENNSLIKHNCKKLKVQKMYPTKLIITSYYLFKNKIKNPHIKGNTDMSWQN